MTTDAESSSDSATGADGRPHAPRPRDRRPSPTSRSSDRPADRPDVRPRPRPGPGLSRALHQPAPVQQAPVQQAPVQQTAVQQASDRPERMSAGRTFAVGLRDAAGYAGRALLAHRSLIVVLVIAAAAATAVRAYVVQPYYIPSASMEPTLHGCPGCTEDRVLVNKLYDADAPESGDIVVFHRPSDDLSVEPVLIKRIVGLPGDTVALRKGLVYINGLRIDEPYVNPKCGKRATQPLTGQSRWRVPTHEVFVMGDNRCDSHDSRAFGPIGTSLIIGRAVAIFWPLNRVGTL